MCRIKGGYYIKARCIQHSEIAHCSPCTREVWDWLLMNAQYEDQKRGDYVVKRGQVFTRYKDIREALCWYVGFAKKTYSEDAMKTAMKTLRSHSMITSTKTRGGMLITVCNYDKYQDPKSYEATSEGPNENTMKPPRSHQGTTDIIKERKELKNEKKLSTTNSTSRRDNERPKQCSDEQWKKYLAYSERFLNRQFATHGNIARKTEPKIISGAKTMDNLIRVKGYDKEYVHRVICWAEEDQFWSANLLSLGALTNKGKNGEIKFCNIAVKMEQEER